MIFTSTPEIDWLVKPTYDEIVAYDRNSFVAKEKGDYYVLDFTETRIYTFRDQGISEITRIENEHPELRSVVKVRFQNDKMKLFNYETLTYLHKDPYYLLQTEHYYKPDSRMIRIFDDLKEGVMSYSGDIIAYPKYEGVAIVDSIIVCFLPEKIEIQNPNTNESIVLEYPGTKAYLIKPKHLIFTSKPNSPFKIQISQTVVRGGVHYIEYTEGKEPARLYGIIDFEGNEIIPFEYTTLSNRQNLYLSASKNGKIDKSGNVANRKEIRYGLIDFKNNIILPFEYKSFGVIQESYLTVENNQGKRAIYDLNSNTFQSDFIYNTWQEADDNLQQFLKNTKTVKIRKDDKVGLADRNGKVLIPPIYRMISETEHNNIYYVYVSETEDTFGGQGFYDIDQGKEIVPARYVDRGGYVPSLRGNESGYIIVMDWESSQIGFYKSDGQLLTDPIYDEYFEGFSDNLGAVSLGETGKSGIIDLNGNLLIDYIFDNLTRPLYLRSIGTIGGKQGIVNLEKLTKHNKRR